jgi:hypothetical protein
MSDEAQQAVLFTCCTDYPGSWKGDVEGRSRFSIDPTIFDQETELDAQSRNVIRWRARSRHRNHVVAEPVDHCLGNVVDASPSHRRLEDLCQARLVNGELATTAILASHVPTRTLHDVRVGQAKPASSTEGNPPYCPLKVVTLDAGNV